VVPGVTLFPADPEPAAPWLIVVQIMDPAGALYAAPLLAHSIRQVEEAATRHVEFLEPGWRPYGAFLAASPIRVEPSPRRFAIPYRS
jgi:hypothetical protein